jgi:hypothetical protein
MTATPELTLLSINIFSVCTPDICKFLISYAPKVSLPTRPIIRVGISNFANATA